MGCPVYTLGSPTITDTFYLTMIMGSPVALQNTIFFNSACLIWTGESGVYMLLKYNIQDNEANIISEQCFIQRVGNLRFPTLQLKFPSSTFADLSRTSITFSPQEHHTSYDAISKSWFLYETLMR